MGVTIEEVQAKQEAGEELNQEEQGVLEAANQAQAEAERLAAEGKVVKDGVEYTKDDQGNFCINNIPVLDSKGVPWHNRGMEAVRIKQEADERLAEANRIHQAELDAARTPKTPEHNPDDIDQETGLTYGALSKIEKKNQAAIDAAVKAEQIRNMNVNANTNITNQKHFLKDSPKYKEFFENPKYVEEMEGHLQHISLESAMMPNIVEEAISLVLGKHIDDIYRDAERKAKTSIEQHREIIGEVKLGKSAGSNAGKTVLITPEIEEAARDMKISVEAAAEVIYKRQARLDARKKK